jgi:hypothetical protein
MCALDPHTEPEGFYEFAVRQCERGLPVVGDRVPEERHVEMLRLRLIEGLTLRQIGDRMDLSGVRVRQLLNEFFGLRRLSRDTEGDPEKVKVPAGFIDLLREMVLREREEGREVIVRALWLREAFEWQRLRDAKGVEHRMVWWHVRQIGAFLTSVGIADEAPTSRLIHAETVPLVRSGALGELACRERVCEQALARREALRALLEVIGWEDDGERRWPKEVHLGAHREALAGAINHKLAGEPAEEERMALGELLDSIGR